MSYLLGIFLGALIATFLLSSLFLWLFRSIGDNPKRLIFAFVAAFVVMFVLSGFGYADGDGFNPWGSLPIYSISFAIWFGVQWFGMRGRRAKEGESKRVLPTLE
ncbi:hypothetical protein PFY01_13255 [Brevundimonas vesicularis]|uniref:hypothetical protein n=1 Tax=Brevundimonas vesicularis TaxID=41276 RepID=UPI0022EC77CD|nr:hypothetical protein [Brevundimonas vesicularis]WBT05673.1 hypothetical protein PFY01_13255 [Brevundimonas vesicularis]